jgi:ABC-2 type transport system ATP-binding protein
METALEVKGVTKSFTDKGKTFFALKDINLALNRGEILGLLGPNGAGKTTLLNIIVGIVLQDKGTVSILGNPNTEKTVFDRINGISAGAHFHYALKPLDILRFYAKVYGIPKAVAEKRMKELVDFFEMNNILDTKFGQLSTGEAAKIAFAKALINDPELLLLDEPTLGLDPYMAMKIRRFIKSLNKKKGLTILLTSHYMQEVEMLADRVAFINQGRIIDEGHIEKVKLKHFTTYDLRITPKEIHNKQLLKKLGFKINKDAISREMSEGEELSEILAALHKAGIEINDMEIKRPTLEDYFMKLSK